MDYIIVVWNEILREILDKGRNLGTSLIIENHISMKNAACRRQGWGVSGWEAAAGAGKPGRMSTSQGEQGQAGQPQYLPSSGSPSPSAEGPPTLPGPPLLLAVRGPGRGGR